LFSLCQAPNVKRKGYELLTAKAVFLHGGQT
jgi:hypothetical protein